MTPKAPAWLLLVTNLPGRNPTLRMRIWRGLKAAGAGSLRDGAYLLPHSAQARQLFEEQSAEIRAAGGFVHILALEADSAEQAAAFVALFDRTPEYVDAIEGLDALKAELPRLREAEARQRLASAGRDAAIIVARQVQPIARRQRRR